MVVNVVLFAAINARMISSQALSSAVPDLADRGAFMSINGSIAQLSGGVAAAVAGLIVVQRPGQPLEHYEVLGYVVSCATILTIGLMYPIHKMVQAKVAKGGPGMGPGGMAPGAGQGPGAGKPAEAPASH
jgi:hypothetical protein